MIKGNKWLKKAIKFKPDDESYRTRFDALRSLTNSIRDAKREKDSGQTDAAIAIYNRVIEDFPNMAEAYYLLGFIKFSPNCFHYK